MAEREQQEEERDQLHLLAVDLDDPPAAGAAATSAEDVAEVEDRAEDVAEVEDEDTEDPAEDEPLFGSGRWVIADSRSGALQTEPRRSNAARARSLLGVATRLRGLVTAEAARLRRLQEDLQSAPTVRALDGVRRWYLQGAFQRRLRAHMEQVRREIAALVDVCGHFDPQAIEQQTGGPALRLLDDLRLSDTDTATAGGLEAPADGQRTDSRAEEAVALLDDEDTSESCSATISSETARAATEVVLVDEVAAEEEVAAGKATEEVAAEEVEYGEATEDVERRMAPVPWRHCRFEKRKTAKEGTSSSSSASRSTDSLLDSAGDLQQAGAAASPADAPMDTLLASVEETEEGAATELLLQLQRHFLELGELLRRQGLVCHGLTSREELRGLLPQGLDHVEEAEAPGQRPPGRDVALVIAQMQHTQVSVARTEAALQHIVNALPPAEAELAPAPAQLPRTPAYERLRSRLLLFQEMLARGFSRGK